MSIQLCAPPATAGRALGVAVLATALVAGAATTPALAAVPPPSYTLTVLAPPVSGTASFALGLSPQGEVVGTARTSPSSRPQFATRWSDDGQATSLGSLPGSTFSRIFAQNARGEAVGEAFNASGTSRAVLVDRDGAVRDLGALGSSAVANDINARGTVVGSSAGTAVVFGPDSPAALPPLDLAVSGTSRADAINDRGQIVGFAPGSVDGVALPVGQATLWNPGGGGYDAIALNRLAAGRFARAYDVNARGTVVGEASRLDGSGASVTRAVRWDGAAVQELPGVDAYRFTRANAVSNDSDLVGHATGFAGFPTIDGAAVLWRDDVAYDLNDLVSDAGGFVLRSAEDVDEHGRIVGLGTVGGQTRGFLLTPVLPGR